ncbi:YtxH domain-containing protein [Heyndrickxia sp. NPDC080065]|uniref:YtxH domain-containing protein n=1 Tax=Heyndrickxia sp. NPDC080065 TaxID=3390568 RepID=UPI003D0472BE
MLRFIKSPIGIAIGVGVTAVLIASPKARATIRKVAVKTISVFLGKEDEIQDADSEMMDQQSPNVKEAVRKVAVKVTKPILGIVETIQNTLTKLQDKWVSNANEHLSDQEINYESSTNSPH